MIEAASILNVAIFFVGAVIGSFFNVCIYRLPKRQSIVWPASHCPRCRASLAVWQNIPILSYLVLRGKCSNCRERIPFRYPLVEFLSGLLLLLVWMRYGAEPEFFHYAVLILLLLPISFIDLDVKLILNVLTLPGMVVGVLFSVFINEVSFLQSIAGLVVGGGFLWSVGLLGRTMFKQESMGGGDIKLGAMIGAFLGPSVVIALFLAFFLALPVIAIGMGTKRVGFGSTIPFGPFISLSTVVVVIFGQTLYEYYLSLLYV